MIAGLLPLVVVVAGVAAAPAAATPAVAPPAAPVDVSQMSAGELRATLQSLLRPRADISNLGAERVRALKAMARIDENARVLMARFPVAVAVTVDGGRTMEIMTFKGAVERVLDEAGLDADDDAAATLAVHLKFIETRGGVLSSTGMHSYTVTMTGALRGPKGPSLPFSAVQQMLGINGAFAIDKGADAGAAAVVDAVLRALMAELTGGFQLDNDEGGRSTGKLNLAREALAASPPPPSMRLRVEGVGVDAHVADALAGEVLRLSRAVGLPVVDDSAAPLATARYRVDLCRPNSTTENEMHQCMRVRAVVAVPGAAPRPVDVSLMFGSFDLGLLLKSPRLATALTEALVASSTPSPSLAKAPTNPVVEALAPLAVVVDTSGFADPAVAAFEGERIGAIVASALGEKGFLASPSVAPKGTLRVTVRASGSAAVVSLRLGPLPEETGRTDGGALSDEVSAVRALVKALTRTY